MSYEEQMRSDREQVERALRDCFSGREPRADLYDAMQYSLMAGGKRLRPVLLLESCRMCGGEVGFLELPIVG